MATPNFYAQVYAVTRAIPAGLVLNYGTVAHLLEKPQAARAVGYALQNLPYNSDVPWHRVVGKHGSRGVISIRGSGHGAAEQIARLQAEGIPFDEANSFPLLRYLWQPDPIEIQAILAKMKADDA